MFVCLSSGAKPRYRQDILRAIAMPRGALLQFRYGLELVTESIQGRIRKDTTRGEMVLIAYLDQSDRTEPPKFVPCRFAKMAAARIHGSTTSLTFELDSFAYVEDVKGFNSHLRTVCKDSLPFRQTADDEYAQGAFWFEVPTEGVSDVIPTYDLHNWENIIGQLVRHQDFARENCFYTIEGLYDVSANTKLEMQSGRYALKPSRDYEIKLYHFLPKKAEQLVYLHFDASPPSTVLTSGRSTLVADSEYDMKSIRFRTGRPTRQERAILSIFRSEQRPDPEFRTLDFDMALSIAGSWRMLLAWGIVVGLLIAGPTVLGQIADPKVTAAKLTVVCLIQTALGLATGILAAFKLGRGI